MTTSSASVEGTDGTNTVQVTLPPQLLQLDVTGDLVRPTHFLMKDLKGSQLLNLVGGKGDDIFEFPIFTQLKGATLVSGGGGVNSANFTFVTQPNNPLAVTISPGSLVAKDSSTRNTLLHSNVQRRNYLIHGAANTK